MSESLIGICVHVIQPCKYIYGTLVLQNAISFNQKLIFKLFFSSNQLVVYTMKCQKCILNVHHNFVEPKVACLFFPHQPSKKHIRIFNLHDAKQKSSKSSHLRETKECLTFYMLVD